ncbi:hypothetical protein Gocc_0149 [Gaiella occulta]|uniref:Uncharacterized protein n=1 Tax=Gaiella occulta TaxID=1002870 RepID=A0A7M2Z0B9_9ACTN|nr:hypothetical protein Gocc_0149 [Gaiella occulta]
MRPFERPATEPIRVFPAPIVAGRVVADIPILPS